MKKSKKIDYNANFNDEKLNSILVDNSNEAEKILSDENKTMEFIKKIVNKLSNIPIVGQYFEDIPLLYGLVIDYVKGNYKEIPVSSIIMTAASLVYFLSPVDLIPDYIPVIGYVDDITVIGFLIKAIHNDLQSYKKWKEKNQ